MWVRAGSGLHVGGAGGGPVTDRAKDNGREGDELAGAKWYAKFTPDVIAAGLQGCRMDDPDTGKLDGLDSIEYSNYTAAILSSYMFSDDIPELERMHFIRTSVRAVFDGPRSHVARS
jgi:hypothetical protein